MKIIKASVLVLFTASLLGVFSCSPDDPPEPTNYPINDFIFNTFLFAEGTWWAFYDSTTGEYDTLSVTYNVGQHQNVYEGNTFKYSRYFYRAEWNWSVNKKRYFIEYSSDRDFDWKGKKLSQIGIDGISNSYGTGYGILYYDNFNLFDTITSGYAYILGDRVSGYFTLEEKGDSLWYQNKWTVNPYVKFTLVKCVAHELQNITLIFQQHYGIIEHSIDGNYILVDQHLLPMIK